jgi:hypothetical protein
MVMGVRIAPVAGREKVQRWCWFALTCECLAIIFPFCRYVSRCAALISRQALLVAQHEAPCLVTMCHTASCILIHAHFLRLAVVSDYTSDTGSVFLWSLRLKLAQVYVQAFVTAARAPSLQNGTWINAMCQSFFATIPFCLLPGACELLGHAMLCFFAVAACLPLSSHVSVVLGLVHVLIALVFNKLILTQLCMLMLLSSCSAITQPIDKGGMAILVLQACSCWPRGTVVGDATALVLQSTLVGLNLNDSAVYAHSIFASCLVDIRFLPSQAVGTWTTFFCCRAAVDVAEKKSFEVYPFLESKYPAAQQVVTKYITQKNVLSQRSVSVRGSSAKEAHNVNVNSE